MQSITEETRMDAILLVEVKVQLIQIEILVTLTV